jgi:segregation and condensation protein B
MDRNQQLRLVEALVFAAGEPVSERAVAQRLPDEADAAGLLAELASIYENRGVRLVHVGSGWAFRTAPDLAGLLQIEKTESRKLSRAAVETLAIVAYHQPVTRAEIEEIRGVSQSKGTLDVLLEAKWVRPGRRRRTPGRPVTWLTTEHFLDSFGLESLRDLPGTKELRAAGFLDARPAIQAFRAEDAEALEDEDEAAPSEFEPLEEDEILLGDAMPDEDDLEPAATEQGS